MNRKKLRKIKSAVFATLLVLSMVGESLTAFAATDIGIDLDPSENEMVMYDPAAALFDSVDEAEVPETAVQGDDIPEAAEQEDGRLETPETLDNTEAPVQELTDEIKDADAEELQPIDESIDGDGLNEEGEDGILTDEEAESDDGSTVKHVFNVPEECPRDGVSPSNNVTRYLLVGETEYFVDFADKSYDNAFVSEYGSAALNRTTKYTCKPSGIVSFSKKKIEGIKFVQVKGKKAGTTVGYRTAYYTTYRTRHIVDIVTKDYQHITYVVCKPDFTQKSFKINDPNSTVNLMSYITGVDGYDDKIGVQFASSNTKVADVSENGVVTFKSKGNAKITATFYSNAGEKCCKATVSFKVVPPVLSKTLAVVKPGKSTKVTLKNVQSAVSWSSKGNVSLTTSGKNNETVSIAGVAPCVTFVYANVSTGSGTMQFKIVVGVEQTEFDQKITVGSEVYEAREDHKMAAQMIDLCNKNRRANGLPEFIAKDNLWNGSDSRARQLMLGNPRGEGTYTDPFGSTTYEMDSYQPASASSSFNFFYKAKTGYLKTVLCDASYKNIGVTVYRTKTKIPVSVSGKTKKCNCFMVTAIGK
ncbi:MAG: Ig-like domain-containing protein [Lachnospiraceae bacterium]|nr:Ig-like domain-containing protein [Lachnospiraceae bacterium]